MRTEKDLTKAINLSLAETGKYINVSRVNIYQRDDKDGLLSCTYSWCNAGIMPIMDTVQQIPKYLSDIWFKTFEEGKIYSTFDINTLDPETSKFVDNHDVKSIVAIPLTINGGYNGIIDFDDCTYKREWEKDDINLIKSLAQIISSAIERHQAEENLLIAKKKAEESDKLKTAFLANLSHEIRTPLNAIVGFSYLMGSEELQQSEKLCYSETIKNNTNQLLKILDDIVDISKLEAGQLDILPTTVKINELMSELQIFFDKRLHEYKKDKTISLMFDNSGCLDNCVINVDEKRLQQVISNLLWNAIKFTENGFIIFGYKLNETDMLEFSVHDTGIGMTQEQVNIIFERFRQVDSQSTREYGGIGLGLSISYSLVKLMGGDMWVKSTLGESTSFFFTIPRC